MIRLRPVVAALALLLAAPACTSKGPEESCARRAANPPTVKLLSAGQAPQEPLRLAIASGQEETMRMTMTMGMAMEMDGSPMMPYTKLPPTVMDMGIDIGTVEKNGDFRYDFALDAVEVLASADSPPGLVEAIRASMADLKGMSGHSTVSNRGEVCDAAFKIPDNVSAQVKQTMEGMQQSLQQIAVPFPEEAVGVGAKWEVITRLDHAQGLTLTQTSTYEILERSGSTVKLATSVTQKAAPQEMHPPGLPPGASVHLESMESSGAGTTVFDLAKVVPADGQMALSTKMAMTVQAMGQKQAMKMTMDLDLKIAPASASAPAK